MNVFVHSNSPIFAPAMQAGHGQSGKFAVSHYDQPDYSVDVSASRAGDVVLKRLSQ